MRVSVALRDLQLSEPRREAAGSRGSKAMKPKPVHFSAPKPAEVGAGFVPMRTSTNTVNLRGMRVEEGLSKVDEFIDQMLRIGEHAAYVLHGHGTGAMKAAVREHLALSPFVERSAPADKDDGGDAFTVFWLKG